MPNTRLFVICGCNRLVVRVVRSLLQADAAVTVIRTAEEGPDFLESLPPSVRVLTTSAARYDQTLTEAGAHEAACLLALAEDDLQNLRASVAAQEIASHVPVVMRMFDPVFADQLEAGLNVRRAYSVSALAAPAFIAAATGGDVLETLSLGTGEVPICRVTVRVGSALVGLTGAELKARHGCALLAQSPDGIAWLHAAEGDAGRPLQAGDHVLLGGLLQDALRLCCRNAGWLTPRRRRPRPRRMAGEEQAGRPRHLTLLPLVAAVLGLVLVTAVFVFGHALKLRPVDALYFVITTATTTGYGDYSLKDAADPLKIFGCFIMLAGGALFGILFSYLAALTTAERLEEVVSRRARRMEGHVVVAGLGNVGYRIAQYLTDLGLGVVVLDRAPNPRFSSALRAPVLTADVRQQDGLDRAAVGRALALIACTNDDLANVQACLHAQRSSPDVVTVARVSDDLLAERLTGAFRISKSLSASQSATSAFVGAALDERAFRPLQVGALRLLACRFAVSSHVGEQEIGAWRAQGIRVLAYRAPNGGLHAPSALRGHLPVGSEVILCGPTNAILSHMGVT